MYSIQGCKLMVTTIIRRNFYWERTDHLESPWSSHLETIDNATTWL